MKTWGEMSKEEKLEILAAHLDGKEVESFVSRLENEKYVSSWGKTVMRFYWDDVPVRIKQ